MTRTLSNLCSACGRSLVLLGLVAMGMVRVPAAELDWSSVTYPGGSLSNTYNNVDGTTVDITFDFPSSGTPVGSNAGSPNPSTGGFAGGSPEINTDVTTNDALYIELQFDPQTPREYVTLDITFSEAVNEVSMTVFDIDFGANDFQDLVIVRGITSGGTAVAPTTLTDDPAFNDTSVGFPGDFTDTIFSDSATDADLQASSIVGLSANGTDDRAFGIWDFGSQELVGVQLVYTNSIAAPNDPDGQWVSLGNVFFTPVIPEAEVYWAGGAMLVLIGFYEFRRRRRQPAQESGQA